jgi:hypothetical protein
MFAVFARHPQPHSVDRALPVQQWTGLNSSNCKLKMRAVFLQYHSAGGETKFASLETANEPVFYLPYEVQADGDIELSTTVPSGRKDYTVLG